MGQKKQFGVSEHRVVGHAVTIRMRPGDLETLNWLTEQLGMSKADVYHRALAAYAQQISVIKRGKSDR